MPKGVYKHHSGEKSHNWKGGKIERRCLICGSIFKATQTQIKRGNGKYCSIKCYWKSLIGRTPRRNKKSGKFINCKFCNKSFYITKSKFGKQKFCSKKCANKELFGITYPSRRKGKIISCAICGKEFYIKKSKINKRKYCSNYCFYQARKKIRGKDHPNWRGGKIKIKCLTCKKEKYVWPSKLKEGNGKYCSYKCFSVSMIGREAWNKGLKTGIIPSSAFKKGQNIGERHPYWKGGITNHMGYIRIYHPDHPFAKKQYVFEHRFVAEKILGRYLDPEERIHHINEIKDDNRPENLYLFDSMKEHCKYHIYLRYGKLLKEQLITKSNLI
jgi:hypothetical protein